MICFDVYLNGDKLCRAGVGDSGVLDAIVAWVGGAPKSRRRGGRTKAGMTDLHVGGLYSPKKGLDAYPRWVRKELRSGDEVTIRVRTARSADKPAECSTKTRTSRRREERKYFLELKKKFEPSGKKSRHRTAGV